MSKPKTNLLENIPGILLLYNHPIAPSANTIMEHVNSFKLHSKYNVWEVNTELGFPAGLKKLKFDIIILHYSIFGIYPYQINNDFLKYLENSTSYKIAFFQDEHRFCKSRFSFINTYGINCIYTLLEPDYFKDTYLKYTKSQKIINTIPGYVSDTLIETAREKRIPDLKRSIDIGYRARPLEFYMGKGAQEKHEIGLRFRALSKQEELALDIEVDENKRIYGSSWYDFLAGCRGFLGVEAGVSIFDIKDIVYENYIKLKDSNPGIGFMQMSDMLLKKWEDNIYYRTISPRHFEAAAFRVCQILFEGRYSGILEPMKHYIPLQKDFSNFSEVIQKFKDANLRQEITENAYRDIIASGRFSYKRFIEEFDKVIEETGFAVLKNTDLLLNIQRIIDKDTFPRTVTANIRSLKYRKFMGRDLMIDMFKHFLRLLNKSKRIKLCAL